MSQFLFKNIRCKFYFRELRIEKRRKVDRSGNGGNKEQLKWKNWKRAHGRVCWIHFSTLDEWWPTYSWRWHFPHYQSFAQTQIQQACSWGSLTLSSLAKSENGHLPTTKCMKYFNLLRISLQCNLYGCVGNLRGNSSKGIRERGKFCIYLFCHMVQVKLVQSGMFHLAILAFSIYWICFFLLLSSFSSITYHNAKSSICSCYWQSLRFLIWLYSLAFKCWIQLSLTQVEFGAHLELQF